jgi:hypothetical protein
LVKILDGKNGLKVDNLAASKNPPVPSHAIHLAKERYFVTLSRLEEERKTYEEVDAFKDEMRWYLTGRVTSLSRGAQEHLAGYAIFCGVIPKDPIVREIAKGILRYWKETWRVDVELDGPLRSNKDLVRRSGVKGVIYDGWLDMTSQSAGRPQVSGKFKISLMALGSAIDELSAYWGRSNYGSKEKGKPSLAARFYHRHIVSFEPDLDVEVINNLLIKRAHKRNR